MALPFPALAAEIREPSAKATTTATQRWAAANNTDDERERELDLSEDWGLYSQAIPVKGRGVFSGKTIPPGRFVLKFKGPLYTKETCPDFSEAIQVSLDLWMWSSGGLDDLVNHSCTPNTGLFPVFSGPSPSLYLVSLRPIAVGEELSFDYSTSMVDEPWKLDGCACSSEDAAGAATSGCRFGCRGEVGNFLSLPAATQDYYASCGALPLHTAQAYLTRGSGKDRGLTKLPLHHATSPLAKLFPLAAYNIQSCSNEAGADDADSDSDSFALVEGSASLAKPGAAGGLVFANKESRSYSVETAATSTSVGTAAAMGVAGASEESTCTATGASSPFYSFTGAGAGAV